jgi:hypothetical protein
MATRRVFELMNLVKASWYELIIEVWGLWITWTIKKDWKYVADGEFWAKLDTNKIEDMLIMLDSLEGHLRRKNFIK